MSQTKRALWVTAYHEAAHAVVTWRYGLPLGDLDLLGGREAAGDRRAAHPSPAVRNAVECPDTAPVERERAILICLAGPAARRRQGGRGWHPERVAADLQLAEHLARRQCSSDRAASRYLHHLGTAVDHLLNDLWPAIEALAETAVAEHRLPASAVADIVKAAAAMDQLSSGSRLQPRSRGYRRRADRAQDRLECADRRRARPGE